MRLYIMSVNLETVLIATAAPAPAQCHRSAKPDFPAQNAARPPDTAPNNTPASTSKLQALSYVPDKQVWPFRVHMQ